MFTTSEKSFAIEEIITAANNAQGWQHFFSPNAMKAFKSLVSPYTFTINDGTQLRTYFVMSSKRDKNVNRFYTAYYWLHTSKAIAVLGTRDDFNTSAKAIKEIKRHIAVNSTPNTIATRATTMLNWYSFIKHTQTFINQDDNLNINDFDSQDYYKAKRENRLGRAACEELLENLVGYNNPTLLVELLGQQKGKALTYTVEKGFDYIDQHYFGLEYVYAMQSLLEFALNRTMQAKAEKDWTVADV